MNLLSCEACDAVIGLITISDIEAAPSGHIVLKIEMSWISAIGNHI